MNINTSYLRAHLKDCLEMLYHGEQINIIHHSAVVAYLIPSAEVQAIIDASQVQALYGLADSELDYEFDQPA